MEIFPQPKPDRRFLSAVPSKTPSRRGDNQRYFMNAAMELRSVKNKKRRLRGKVVDISDNGVLIETNAKAAVGDVFLLKIHIPPGAMPEGFESTVRLRGAVVRHGQKDNQLAFAFDKPISGYLRKRRWLLFETMALLLIFFVILGIYYIKEDSIFYFWFDVPIFLYGLTAITFLLSRFLFAALYRKYPADPEFLPHVSVIIPCFNEEEWITTTIRTSLNQYYPEDRLEVVVVDDCSTDNSLQVIRDLQQNNPEVAERLVVVPLPNNQGKRHALAAGVAQSRGDFLVFVDSDSFLQPDAVSELIQPMRDPKIAGATGRCEVENKWTNFLTKMQAVRYFIGFRIFKSAESIFNAVTCLSGPLSCYRRETVLYYLEDWVNQHFLGRQATFGDDRSLTNFLLKKNRTVYQDSAVCSTIVPSTLKKFLKQQMRWKRSWFRETLRASGFMWRKEPFMAISFYLGFILPILAPAVVLRAFVYYPFIYRIFPVMYLAGIFLMAMLMCTSYLLLKRSNLWVHGVPFCFFYLFVLLWQIIPATLTFWKSEWGTRPSAYDAPQPDAVSVTRQSKGPARPGAVVE